MNLRLSKAGISELKIKTISDTGSDMDWSDKIQTVWISLIKGSKTVPNKIAFVPQEAWIFGGTIRENILVGREYQKEFYDRVIQACSLVSDFENFPSRDQTFVGEKGVTLRYFLLLFNHS